MLELVLSDTYHIDNNEPLKLPDTRAVKPERRVQSGCEAERYPRFRVQRHTNGSDDTIELSGYSLILNSETTIKIYFKTDSIEGKSFDIDPVKYSKNSYYVKLENIAAADLDNSYTIRLGNKAIECSALSYAYTFLKNSSDDDLRYLVKALKVYNDKAEAYRSAQNSQ